MKCVKTGLRFKVPAQSGDTYHGDMYYYEDTKCLVIRGIPSGVTDFTPHITLERVNDTFTVGETALDFLSWWQQWNPNIRLEGTLIIIADSRF